MFNRQFGLPTLLLAIFVAWPGAGNSADTQSPTVVVTLNDGRTLTGQLSPAPGSRLRFLTNLDTVGVSAEKIVTYLYGALELAGIGTVTGSFTDGALIVVTPQGEVRQAAKNIVSILPHYQTIVAQGPASQNAPAGNLAASPLGTGNGKPLVEKTTKANPTETTKPDYDAYCSLFENSPVAKEYANKIAKIAQLRSETKLTKVFDMNKLRLTEIDGIEGSWSNFDTKDKLLEKWVVEQTQKQWKQAGNYTPQQKYDTALNYCAYKHRNEDLKYIYFSNDRFNESDIDNKLYHLAYSLPKPIRKMDNNGNIVTETPPADWGGTLGFFRYPCCLLPIALMIDGSDKVVASIGKQVFARLDTITAALEKRQKAQTNEKAAAVVVPHPLTFSKAVDAARVFLDYLRLGQGRTAAQGVADSVMAPVFEGAELAAKHPDWTEEDYVIELNKQYGYNPAWDQTPKDTRLALVKEIRSDNLSAAEINNIKKVAKAALAACFNAENKIRPSERPSDPVEDCSKRVKRGEYIEKQ